MPEVNIDLNGVLKLLLKLNPGKAVGPDKIKPIVLKALSVEIAPVICLLFERSLHTGQLPIEWTKAQVCPFSRRVINLTRPLIGPSDTANNKSIFLTCILCKVMEQTCIQYFRTPHSA